MNSPGTATLRLRIPADMAHLPLAELEARAPARTGLMVLAAHREGDVLLVTVPTDQPWEAPV